MAVSSFESCQQNVSFQFLSGTEMDSFLWSAFQIQMISISVWSVGQQTGLPGIILASVTGIIAGSLFSRHGLRNRLRARRLSAC